MGWLRLVGSLKLQVSFAEYHLFYRALFAEETYNLKKPTNRSHLIVYKITRELMFSSVFTTHKNSTLLNSICTTRITIENSGKTRF